MVKNTAGNIIDWFDEADGGWIVQKGTIKNQEKWDAYQKKLADDREAALAMAKQKVDPNAPDRSTAPSKIADVEKKVAGLETKISDQDKKLDAILAALKK